VKLRDTVDIKIKGTNNPIKKISALDLLRALYLHIKVSSENKEKGQIVFNQLFDQIEIKLTEVLNDPRDKYILLSIRNLAQNKIMNTIMDEGLLVDYAKGKLTTNLLLAAVKQAAVDIINEEKKGEQLVLGNE